MNETITIGIPAYNEKERIRYLFYDLYRQVKHEERVKEIIVNASGSTDGTELEINKISRELQDLRIKVIMRKERLGKASALNEILCEANGDIICFIDADVVLGDKCIHHLIAPLIDNPEIGVVSGNVLSLNRGNNIFDFFSIFQRELHNELCIHLMRNGFPPKVNGTFYAIRKKAVSYFHQYIVSDDEFASCSAQRRGYRVFYVPEAIVYTKDPTNLQDYIAKRRRIFCGHLLIKKTLNYTVPTASFRLVIPVFFKMCLKYWRKIPQIIIMLLIEFLSRFLAFCDAVSGRIPFRYRVDSAKFDRNEFILSKRERKR